MKKLAAQFALHISDDISTTTIDPSLGISRFRGNYQSPTMRFVLTIGAVIWLGASAEVEAVDQEPLEMLNILRESANTFAPTFYQHVAAREKGNFACSPFNEWMILTMAAYGARGLTEKQMRTALEHPQNGTHSKIALQALADRLQNYGTARLNITNRILVNDWLPPTSKFRNLTKDIFRSEVQIVKFSNQRTICKPLNALFKSETSTRMKCLQEPIEVDSLAPMIFLSTVYFKSKWPASFFTEPKPQPFRLNSSDEVDVETMCITDTFSIRSLPDLTAWSIEIPFKSTGANDALSMFIIWPRDVNGLPNVEKNLRKITIKNLLHGAPTLMKLCLPKFKIESEILLNPVLQDMGITDMFSSTNAYFSEVSENRPVYVSHVVQKTVIDITTGDEEQHQPTQAPADPLLFKVDHPFMGIIAAPDNDSLELIAFRYTGPTPEEFYDSRFTVPVQTFERYLV